MTPALPTFVFVPSRRAYTNVHESVGDQNYLVLDTIAPQVNYGAGGTNFWLYWTGISGVTYQVWSSTNLINWFPFGPALPGSNGPMQLVLSNGNSRMQFFRLRASN